MLHLMSREGRFLDSHPGILPPILPPSAYIGKYLRDIFPPEIARAAEDFIREALQTGDVQTWDYVLPQFPDYTFEARFSPTDQGEVLVTIRDVTQVRQIQTRLEQAVEERTRELATSNEALMSFAYAASHDLREPLTKILAFGNRLKEMLSGVMPPKGAEYLDVMLSGAKRMTNLIDDLLAYSRAGGKESVPPGPVDLNRIVDEVVIDLETPIQETAAVITVGRLPTVWGYPGRLRQVVQNLLSNALKFHKVNEPPRISIEGREEEDRGIVTVEDKGIGFGLEDAEALFTIFTRLHTRFEYPGTGVGLALCRRLLSQMGGTIEASGQPGVGALFTLSLSLATAEARHA